MLISTMLFVGSSATSATGAQPTSSSATGAPPTSSSTTGAPPTSSSATGAPPTSSSDFPEIVEVRGAGTEIANGLYNLRDTGATMPSGFMPYYNGKPKNWKEELGGRSWYEKEDGSCLIFFSLHHCNDWNLYDRKGRCLYDSDSTARVPPTTGWKFYRKQAKDPAPALRYQCSVCRGTGTTCDQAAPCSVRKHCNLCGGNGTMETWTNLRELTLRKMLAQECHGLCRTDTGPVGHGPDWIAPDKIRRRLTSDAAGYGSSETPDRSRLWKESSHGASAHHRTGRLLASEATGSAC